MQAKLLSLRCVLMAVFLIVVIFVINPLSRYWTLISYQLKFYAAVDYPLHDFSPSLPSIQEHCAINYAWRGNDKFTVYNCREYDSVLTIGIVSFHQFPNAEGVYEERLTRYEKLILSNHVGYVMQHKYVYFDMNDVIFNDVSIRDYFEQTMPASNAFYKAQKPFILHSILNDITYGRMLDYLVWMDFDAIFFNCSTSIESVIAYAHELYSTHSVRYNPSENTNAMDMIFTRDYFSVTNAGVVIYKNTEWVKHKLVTQMYVFEHADRFRFAHVYHTMHRIVDQNVLNAVVMGFEPRLNDTSYLASDTAFHEFQHSLQMEHEIHSLVPKWHSWSRCLEDELQFVSIHDGYIAPDIRKHSAMIPQFYLNVLMGEWIYAKSYKPYKFPYDPMIVHFASSEGKPYLSSPDFKELRCAADATGS